jgi:hypothetical protein
MTPAPDIGAPDVTAVKKTTYLVVLDKLGFSREDPVGIAPGFNLDDQISEEGDEDTCGIPDYTSPEGEEGIDNQLAFIEPALGAVGLGAAEDLIQSTIQEGGILIMMQIDGVDDLVNDPEVQLTIRTGLGVPLLGTDGLLLSGQTFHLHPESPDSLAQIGTIEDGILNAGPFVAILPIRVFGVDYAVTFERTRIRARWTEDGGLEDGMMGGSIPVADLLAVGERAAIDDGSVLTGLKLVLNGTADMDKNEEGKCMSISGTFVFTGVSAFYFPGGE